jgi:hypothetical protein
MKTRRADDLAGSGRRQQRVRRAYLLNEALVYFSVVVVILGCGYAALYHLIDHSMVMRRSADDVSKALHAGERWRADLRASRNQLWSEDSGGGRVLWLSGGRADVAYQFATNSVLRRHGKGPWVPVLTQVKSSSMQAEQRQNVTAWRWELELEPRKKGSVRPGRILPLFTFIAVPESSLNK